MSNHVVINALDYYRTRVKAELKRKFLSVCMFNILFKIRDEPSQEIGLLTIENEPFIVILLELYCISTIEAWLKLNMQISGTMKCMYIYIVLNVTDGIESKYPLIVFLSTSRAQYDTSTVTQVRSITSMSVGYGMH